MFIVSRWRCRVPRCPNENLMCSHAPSDDWISTGNAARVRFEIRYETDRTDAEACQAITASGNARTPGT